MIKKQKLLYFYTSSSTFVEKDIDILNQHYQVIRFGFNLYAKRSLILNVFRQFFFILQHLFGSPLFVCQFASMHACLPVFMAKLLGKKCIIVAGGTDCVSFPSIHYGNFSKPWSARLTAYCYNNATLILPVHESLVLYDYTYQNLDHPKQGIKYFLPNLKTPVQVIHNGYDFDFWSRGEVQKINQSFVTAVGHINPRFTFQLKGLDLFVKAAEHFPQATFTIVGGEPLQINNKPNNLFLLPNLWGKKLADFLATQRFYVQLSLSEGFPNALSEAMLCECVPVVSEVGAMPFIVDRFGYVLKHKDENLLFELISSAIGDVNLEQKGKDARMRIKQNFTFERRKNELLKALETHLSSLAKGSLHRP